MLRIITITLLSFAALVPFLVIFHRLAGLEDDVAGYLSMFFAWFMTPLILLRVWRPKPGIEALPVDPDDPIMQEHVQTAQAQLDRFRRGLREGKLEAFVRFAHEFDGVTEHVWGAAHSEKEDGSFVVSLASDPVGEPDDEMLQRFSVPKHDVTDWMLADARGTTYGGYTMLAMAEIYERDYGKLPKQYQRDLRHFADFKWKPKGRNR